MGIKYFYMRKLHQFETPRNRFSRFKILSRHSEPLGISVPEDVAWGRMSDGDTPPLSVRFASWTSATLQPAHPSEEKMCGTIIVFVIYSLKG